MNLKRHVVRKDGQEHVYYSLSETIRINKNRTVQRRVLNLGELNTTQTEQGLPLSYEVFRVTVRTSPRWRKSWTPWKVNMASWAESGSSIAGSSVKRTLTCYVPEARHMIGSK